MWFGGQCGTYSLAIQTYQESSEEYSSSRVLSIGRCSGCCILFEIIVTGNVVYLLRMSKFIVILTITHLHSTTNVKEEKRLILDIYRWSKKCWRGRRWRVFHSSSPNSNLQTVWLNRLLRRCGCVMFFARGVWLAGKLANKKNFDAWWRCNAVGWWTNVAVLIE